MKSQVTQKYIKTIWGNDIYKIYYCDAQSLLYDLSPFAYNSGVYGWNCDYYNIGGIIISTGYRPHGKKVNYEILRKYEEKAKKVIYDYDFDYEIKCKLIEQYRNKFIRDITK